MSRFLGSTPFAELLPASIANDAAVRAVADALSPVLNASVRDIMRVCVRARLLGAAADMAPPLQRIAGLSGGLQPPDEALLALLAWELHVEGYESASTFAERWALVRGSIPVHRKKGTKWAVETAVESALQDVRASVVEWFEYGAAPYHFRVVLDVFGDTFLASAVIRAMRLVNETKSIRSHCDGYTVARNVINEFFTGAVTCVASVILIEPETVTEIDCIAQGLCAALSQHHQSVMSINPE